MPAYIRDLSKPECIFCHKKATVQFFNHVNAPGAYFCKIHGRREVARYNKELRKEII